MAQIHLTTKNETLIIQGTLQEFLINVHRASMVILVDFDYIRILCPRLAKTGKPQVTTDQSFDLITAIIPVFRLIIA